MNLTSGVKYLVFGALTFFSDKVWAAREVPLYGSPNGITSSQADMPILFLIPLTLVLIFISGIVSPIIGYRWYMKHGGAKKWLGWFAFLPLVSVVIWLSILLLNNILGY